ncbi:glycosyl hydrolase 108 family protein [Bradyrhizobium sp. dw_78]|uniref:glycosyl hydrolase 108 family protein n=1 Tax=Bradyrhizobium sp. dw_78 TaxID=2719793 RepID=UPI0032084771
MVDTSENTRFAICLPFTLKQEGGNSDDPHDPGGRTHKGIIQREYDKYRRSKGLPLRSDFLSRRCAAD